MSHSKEFNNLEVLRLPVTRIPVYYKIVKGKIIISPDTIINQLGNFKVALENCDFLDTWFDDFLCSFFDWDIVKMNGVLMYLDSLPILLRTFLETMALEQFFSKDMAVEYWDYQNFRKTVSSIPGSLPEYYPMVSDVDIVTQYFPQDDDDFEEIS